MQSLLHELKRRRVLQTAAVYVAAAWAATEMLGFLLPALNFPRWTVTIVAILLVLGFPVTMLGSVYPLNIEKVSMIHAMVLDVV